MVSYLVFSQLGLIALVGLFLMRSGLWPSVSAAARPMTPKPLLPRGKHSQKPTPFPGLTRQPCCAAGEQVSEAPRLRPSPPPPPTMPSPRGRRRHVDTSHHVCPAPACRYGGWLGRGKITANGPPTGGPWRQLYCSTCRGYFLETYGTPLPGKRVSPERLVGAVGALAEGLGIRAVARGFEVAPNPGLAWLVEVADHAAAFSQYFLHGGRVTQVQLDELFALLRAVKAGASRNPAASQRLSRSPHWVWTAMEPVTKLLLGLDSGERTLAMAQRVVPQVSQVLAPGCGPLFLTAGFKESTTALRTHYGQGVQAPRQRAQGPAPTPRWMPLPGLLYAQVVQTVRRRRLVRVRPRVVFGTLDAMQQGLAACGWQSQTAFVERLNLTIRQQVAAVGRRVSTLCKGEDGMRQQLGLYHIYAHFCFPHASLRVSLPQPLPTHGTGSAKQWRPQTPAMAAGLTDQVWTLREVWLFRVPPWPQPVQA
jgi:IS1 family transposase